MKRIILHWTAGKLQPNNVDSEHYHYLVTGDSLVIEGKYTPKDNENCQDGKYAAHTGGGNTGSIGVALCGMLGYQSRYKTGSQLLKQSQCERAFKLMAELAKEYNIQIDSDHIMTHYEFGQKNPNTSSYGKIDITYLPPYPNVTQSGIGDFIRNKVKWYYKNMVK